MFGVGFLIAVLQTSALSIPTPLRPNLSRADECEVNAVGASETPELWEIADTHAHQFANLAIGGKVFWGPPFFAGGTFESGIARALPRCDPAHGPHGRDDIVGNLLRGGFSGIVSGHETSGYPWFESWPKWDTRTHQQMYVSWLERAYKAGLRLMVMHAVNAEGLCRVPVVMRRLQPS